MTNKNKAGTGLYTRFKTLLHDAGAGIRGINRRFNHAMRGHYSPRGGALLSVMIVLVMSVITLFVPPIVGVADDGSLSAVMERTGLAYRKQDLEPPIGAYFTRVLLTAQEKGEAVSTHFLIIHLAKGLDHLFTRDQLFDLRFLGLVYLLLYLPGVFLVADGVLQRVKMPIEAVFIAVLCGIIFGDSGMVGYFNSLYPEAMWIVCLTHVIGFFLMLQHSGALLRQLALLGLGISGAFLLLTESHLAAAGFVLAAFVTPLMFRDNRLHMFSGLVILTVIVLFSASLITWNVGANRFTETSKLHAMTNGVLTRADDPGKALEEFGIESRFETLTDTFSYADYPYALSGQKEIREDFLSRYNTELIGLYYLRHPLQAYGMLEIGTRAALGSARTYIGSYERSLGLPERARNPFLSFYGNFHAGAFPKTVGFLIVMSVIYLLLFRRKKSLSLFPEQEQGRRIMLSCYFCLLLMGMANILTVICMSGTAELERYQMFYGLCIDMMFVLLLCEALHKLKILSDEENV